YPSDVSNTGHGLQRAFVLTMLQHLALVESRSVATLNAKLENASQNVERTTTAPGKFRLPNLVIGIEEPELYQHPSRQRHISNVLQTLVSGTTGNVAEQTQVIFSTHSPL